MNAPAKTKRDGSEPMATQVALAKTLENRRDQIALWMGEGAAAHDVNILEFQIKMAFAASPDLLRCTGESIVQAIEAAASYRLQLGTVQPDAYLVPRGNRCCLDLSYSGLLRLAKESGAIADHVARSVHEGDVFECSTGLHPSLTHRELGSVRTWETCTDVYAHFLLPDGREKLYRMTRAQVEEHRDKHATATGAGSPWQTHTLQMALKTVVRQPFNRREILISGRYANVIEAATIEVAPSVPSEYVNESAASEPGAKLFDTHDNTGQ